MKKKIKFKEMGNKRKLPKGYYLKGGKIMYRPGGTYDVPDEPVNEYGETEAEYYAAMEAAQNKDAQNSGANPNKKNNAKQGQAFAKGAQQLGQSGGQFLTAMAQQKDGTVDQGMAGVGGALSGAATGASLGSMFGPIGTAIGAVGGGLIGGIDAASQAGNRNATIAQQKRAEQRRAEDLVRAKSRTYLDNYNRSGRVGQEVIAKFGGKLPYANGGKMNPPIKVLPSNKQKSKPFSPYFKGHIGLENDSDPFTNAYKPTFEGIGKYQVNPNLAITAYGGYEPIANMQGYNVPPRGSIGAQYQVNPNLLLKGNIDIDDRGIGGFKVGARQNIGVRKNQTNKYLYTSGGKMNPMYKDGGIYNTDPPKKKGVKQKTVTIDMEKEYGIHPNSVEGNELGFKMAKEGLAKGITYRFKCSGGQQCAGAVNTLEQNIGKRLQEEITSLKGELKEITPEKWRGSYYDELQKKEVKNLGIYKRKDAWTPTDKEYADVLYTSPYYQKQYDEIPIDKRTTPLKRNPDGTLPKEVIMNPAYDYAAFGGDRANTASSIKYAKSRGGLNRAGNKGMEHVMRFGQGTVTHPVTGEVGRLYSSQYATADEGGGKGGQAYNTFGFASETQPIGHHWGEDKYSLVDITKPKSHSEARALKKELNEAIRAQKIANIRIPQVESMPQVEANTTSTAPIQMYKTMPKEIIPRDIKASSNRYNEFQYGGNMNPNKVMNRYNRIMKRTGVDPCANRYDAPMMQPTTGQFKSPVMQQGVQHTPQPQMSRPKFRLSTKPYVPTMQTNPTTNLGYSEAFKQTDPYNTQASTFTNVAKFGGKMKTGCGCGSGCGCGGKMKKFEAGGQMKESTMPPVLNQGGVLQQTSSNTATAEGATHEQGGIELPKGEIEDNEVLQNAEDGTINIFSDKLEVSPGVTFAAKADKISKKKGKFENRLSNNSPYVRNSAKRNIQKLDDELKMLFEQQEAMKPNIPQQQMANQQVMAGGGKMYRKGKPLMDDGGSMTTQLPDQYATTFQQGLDYLSPAINAALIARTPDIPEPINKQAYIVDPTVNINPQLAEQKRQLANLKSTLSRTTSSGVDRRNQMIAASAKATEQTGKLMGMKENLEAQRKAANIKEQQRISNINRAQEDKYRRDKMHRIDDIHQRISKLGSETSNIMQRQQAEQNKYELDKTKLGILEQKYKETGVYDRNLQNVIEGGKQGKKSFDEVVGDLKGRAKKIYMDLMGKTEDELADEKWNRQERRSLKKAEIEADKRARQGERKLKKEQRQIDKAEKDYLSGKYSTSRSKQTKKLRRKADKILKRADRFQRKYNRKKNKNDIGFEDTLGYGLDFYS
jgi:hypothetical protein